MSTVDPNNVLELKTHLNLPFNIDVNNNRYQLKILSIADIFELLEYIQATHLKEELLSTKELLDLNDKDTRELAKELKANQDKLTFSNFNDVFKYIMLNFGIKDIINILSWAIIKYNSINKNIKELKIELNNSINNENFSEFTNCTLRLLGIPTSGQEIEEELDITNDEQNGNDSNVSKSTNLLDIKKNS
jgi:hypothetical protein